MTEVLLHFGRPGRTVNSDDIRSHRLQCDEGRADFCADEHSSGGFHCDLHLDRNFASLAAHRPTTCLHRRLDLQQIHACFNEKEINSAPQQTLRLFGVCIAQFAKTDVSEARQFRSRSDRTGYESSSPVCFESAGNFTGEDASGNIQIKGALGDVIFFKHG